MGFLKRHKAYFVSRLIVPELQFKDLGCHGLGLLFRVARGYGGKHKYPFAN